MYNNLLTYIVTSPNFFAMGHHWVASLSNYNFALICQSGKTNLDADDLSHILRVENNQHIEAAYVHALIVQEAQGTTLIEAYYCDIWVTETLDIQNDPKVISAEDWVVT